MVLLLDIIAASALARSGSTFDWARWAFQVSTEEQSSWCVLMDKMPLSINWLLAVIEIFIVATSWSSFSVGGSSWKRIFMFTWTFTTEDFHSINRRQFESEARRRNIQRWLSVSWLWKCLVFGHSYGLSIELAFGKTTLSDVELSRCI